MATIKTRRNKFSVIYWYIDEFGQRRQKWDTLQSKKEAQSRKAFIEYYQKENGYVLVPKEKQFSKDIEASKRKLGIPGDQITVKEFLEVYVNLYGVSKWSLSTYSSKVATIDNYINPLIGELHLTDLTTKRLTQFYNDLLNVPEVPKAHRYPTGRCVQPANIKKIHDILRSALNCALKWEYLDPIMRNPATLVTLPKIPKNKRKVWSVETFKQALQACDDDLLKICMQLAFSCSMRIGEITGLTWDDVVIDEESIVSGNARVIINKELTRESFEAMQILKDKDIVKVFPTLIPNCTTRLLLKSPKTETSNRTVWLPKTVASYLVEYKKAQDEMKEFLGSGYNDYNLVVALDNGNPCESRVVRKRFDNLCCENGFEKVVFHSLRHLSTKYKLKMTGGDIKSVQGDTGHAEAEMVTDVYSEIVDEDRRLNAQKMDQDFYSQIIEPEPVEAISEEEKLLEILRNLSAEEKHRLLQSADRTNPKI